jgi:RNA 2',3'-cyclic 3'-phosphodiesterase
VVGLLGRVFVAAPLPDEVRIALADRLREVEVPGKVAPPENWHITLRFLGSLDEVVYERFLGLMDTSDLGHSFRAGLGGLGAFPRPRSATVVWVDVDRGGDRLFELSAVCEEAAQGAGLAPEDRPFRPHLTLSRLRPGQDVTDLVSGSGGFGIQWRCDSVVVYRSHLGRGGARYEPLETLPLIR